MSQNAARDLRYGRRGGRWANDVSGNVETILDGFDALRQSSPDWPDPSSNQTREPETEEEWEGRSRLAQARALAGLELNPTDRRALELCPRPPSAFRPGVLLEPISWGPGDEALAPGPPLRSGGTVSVPSLSTPPEPRPPAE